MDINTEAANMEEDPCNTNCTTHYMNQNDELQECPQIQNRHLCFTTDAYEEFYSNIKWNKLVRIIDDKFEEFNALLTREYRDENSVFQTLFKNVFSIFDKTLDRDRLNDEDNLFITKNISTDRGLCNDINYTFSIPNKKNREYRIFHISLHSKAPVVEIREQRSKYICKYFEKNITNGVVEEGDGSGPFHFKIDNPKREHGKEDNLGVINIVDLANGKLNPINTMKAPFKTFEDNNNNCRFNNNDAEFIVPASFDKILTVDDYALHKYIYNKFVDFWNNNILPEVHVNSSPVLKIQKHIRGILTRRRYKKQKSASIKIQKHIRGKLTRSKYSALSKKTAKSYSPSKSKNSIKRAATI